MTAWEQLLSAAEDGECLARCARDLRARYRQLSEDDAMDAVLDAVECLLAYRYRGGQAYLDLAAARQWPRSIERTGEGCPRAWTEEGIDPSRRLLRFADFFFRNYRFRIHLRNLKGEATEPLVDEPDVERAMLEMVIGGMDSDESVAQTTKDKWKEMLELVQQEAAPAKKGVMVNWESVYRAMNLHESSGRRLRKGLAAYMAKRLGEVH